MEQEIKTQPLHQDGPVEEQRPNDERFQAILHSELVDFFILYNLIDARLRWLCSMYDFKSFKELAEYYQTYVVPNLKRYENSENVSSRGE